MFNGATVTLAGYVAKEPYYRVVNDKTPLVSMRVAWTSRFMDRETGEWRDGKTSFATVNCWRKLAGNVASSLRKGQAIVLTGRLQVREYDDKEGRRRIAVDIEADSIGHDLSRGVTHFLRTRPSPDDMTAEGLARGEAIRAGLTDEDSPASDLPGLVPAGSVPGDGAGSSEDMFNTDAVSELAGAADTAAAAAVPF
jgi:single-strand DNA-binding protein